MAESDVSLTVNPVEITTPNFEGGGSSFMSGPMVTPSESELKAQITALPESEGEVEEIIAEHNPYQGIIDYVRERFERAKDGRRQDEERWLLAYLNFRGQYHPDVQFTDTEKSRAFIKITKTKVLAAYAKTIDVLFSGGKFPIGIEPSKIPEDIAEEVHFDPKEKTGNNPEVPSAVARPSIRDKVGPLKESLDRLPETVELKEGPGKTPSSATFEPAKVAAARMEEKIHDQLEEANASKHLRAVVMEMALFGTGIMKGPFAQSKDYPKWDDKGVYTPVKKTVPSLNMVSVWDAYPDPEARSVEDCEYFIERHRMSRTQLRALKRRPMFRTSNIEAAIERGPDYVEEDWEHELIEDTYDATQGNTRWLVLEFWGMVDREELDKLLENEPDALQIPEEFDDLDELQANIWVCNGEVIRLVLNPFIPARIPYQAVPYEINPYSFFGIGVAENMMDTQLIMNGFFRLAIDNATLSSNIIVEIDEENLVPGQDMVLYPGKVFRRQMGSVGNAINAIKWPNVTQECMLVFDKARQLADEATGIPSYAHGMSGIMSTGRTAAGMSMLMGAADQNIKSVIRNIDDYLLVPYGKGHFAFNMQFDFDPSIKGDLEVIALGTESLMRNEVRSQKLLQFLQITANPTDLPFVKRDYGLRELAKSLDLDPDKLVNDPREAAIQAAQIREMNQTLGVEMAPEAMAPSGNPAGMPSLSDGTGQAGAGVPGMAPNPGETGFSGNAVPPNIGEVM